MERDILVAGLSQEINEYLEETGGGQQAIQEARSVLRGYRLGREACTGWEEAQVMTIHIADKLLQTALSATLEKNSRKNRRGTR